MGSFAQELGKREIKGDGEGKEVSLEADMTFLVPCVSTDWLSFDMTQTKVGKGRDSRLNVIPAGSFYLSLPLPPPFFLFPNSRANEPICRL